MPPNTWASLIILSLSGTVGVSPGDIPSARQRGRAMSTAVVFAFLVVFLGADITLTDQKIRNEIKLIDNGYEGILIAIGEAVPVSHRHILISRIKVCLL